VRELEDVLQEAEEKGWRVTRGKGYFKMFCPCPDKHRRWVHLSPSTRNYEKHLRQWLQHYTCWEEEKV
jgi:hypothetical protein